MSFGNCCIGIEIAYNALFAKYTSSALLIWLPCYSFIHSFIPSPPTILPSILTSSCHLFLGLPLNSLFPNSYIILFWEFPIMRSFYTLESTLYLYYLSGSLVLARLVWCHYYAFILSYIWVCCVNPFDIQDGAHLPWHPIFYNGRVRLEGILRHSVQLYLQPT
jgi:hypothetical protein